MPELPEVEVVGRGVSAALLGRRLTGLVRRCERLRWPRTNSDTGEMAPVTLD